MLWEDAAMTEAWGMVVAAVIGFGGLFIGLLVGRQQVRDQAQVEHGQWLRNQRMQAYVTLLDEWDAAHKRLSTMWNQALDLIAADLNGTYVGDEVDVSNTLLDRMRDTSKPPITAYERVEMLGPDEVTAAVAGLKNSLQELEAVVRARLHMFARERLTPVALEEGPWEESGLAATRARQTFVDRSRGALKITPSPTIQAHMPPE